MGKAKHSNRAWFGQQKGSVEPFYREKQKEIQGISKQRGRKPANTLQEYKYENKRLKMENELLRDFLSLTERM